MLLILQLYSSGPAQSTRYVLATLALEITDHVREVGLEIAEAQVGEPENTHLILDHPLSKTATPGRY
jgi:hypothetical protein